MQFDELIDVRNIDTSISKMTKDQAIDSLINLLYSNDYIGSSEEYKKAIYKRENEISTAVGYGVAIPHAKTGTVAKATIAILRNLSGIQWGDEKVNLVFMIAAEEKATDEHLKMLSRISASLMDETFRAKLITAETSQDIYKVLLKEDTDKKNEEDMAASHDFSGKYVIGISACMTGIAHTFMAAQALTDEAKKRGMKVKIQTNGSTGIENKLDATDIAEADAIIVAHDVKVDESIFGDKKFIDVPVKKVINSASDILDQALALNAK